MSSWKKKRCRLLRTWHKLGLRAPWQPGVLYNSMNCKWDSFRPEGTGATSSLTEFLSLPFENTYKQTIKLLPHAHYYWMRMSFLPESTIHHVHSSMEFLIIYHKIDHQTAPKKVKQGGKCTIHYSAKSPNPLKKNCQFIACSVIHQQGLQTI